MKNQILSYFPPDHPWRDTIQFFPSITSTNDVLKTMAQQGAPHGTVLIADSQSEGRGRMGRSFQSPPNSGIYMSVLLRPMCRPDALMHLTCAAGVAACDAIEAAAGFRPNIKWTNDIVYQRKKLAGILVEMGLDDHLNTDYAVIGIGINCNQSISDFPEDIRDFAGSLSMFSDKSIDRALVTASMINAFFKMDGILLPDKKSILQRYRQDCITIGQEVSILKNGQPLRGKALDINDEGALVVAFSDGTIQAVNSGEVSVRGLYHYV